MEIGEVNEKCLQQAGRLLAYKARTRGELRRALQKKGYSDEDIEACLHQLADYQLVDDLEYARLYIETQMERGRGMARIRADLAAKEVSRDVIEDALAQMEDLPPEEPRAMEIALGSLEGIDLTGLDYREREKLKARIARRLASRGFRSQTIYRVVSEAIDRAQQEQEEAYAHGEL